MEVFDTPMSEAAMPLPEDMLPCLRLWCHMGCSDAPVKGFAAPIESFSIFKDCDVSAGGCDPLRCDGRFCCSH